MRRPELPPDYLLGGILYGLGHFIRDRDRSGRGVPPETRAGLQWLLTMSSARHEDDCDETQLDDDDLIGTAEAAALLGLSQRQVQRLQNDLGGVRPSGRLVFVRRQVVEYADARREHRGVA